MFFLKPKHTVESVAAELVRGLEDGTVVLSGVAEKDHPHPNGQGANGRGPNTGAEVAKREAEVGRLVQNPG